MRQAGDVLFSQVFRDRGGKFDKLFCPFIYPLYKMYEQTKIQKLGIRRTILFFSILWLVYSQHSEDLEVLAERPDIPSEA